MIAYLASKVPDDEQVLIMVETVEHGMYLKRLLPEFTFVYGNINPTEYHDYKRDGFTGDDPLKPKDRNRLKQEFAEGTLKKVISTTVWKQAVDFPKLSMLIRAEGSASIIASTQIPGRLSRIADGKDKGVLIDFVDGFDPWASARAAKRIRLYREKKWNIIRKGTVDA
jgi:superfamily II DNA or RNA helicase